MKVCKVDSFERQILQNLHQNREGLRAKTLIKLTNLKQRTLYKKLNLLKDKGLIENIFPIWKLLNGQVKYVQSLLKSDIFELHNLSYVLKLISKPDWWSKRKPRLMRLKGWQFSNHNFGKNNSNPYQQIINENFVIQTFPESIILISRKRYYSNFPYEVITQAINDVLDIIDYFQELVRYKFFKEGIPALEIRGSDFNRLSDHLANHCKKEGRRFLVELDKNRKVWVDYSEPFGKEANYPEGQEILEKVTKDFLLNKPLMNSELQGLIQQVTKNQLIFDANMSSHLEVLENIGQAITELKEEVKNLNGRKKAN